MGGDKHRLASELFSQNLVLVMVNLHTRRKMGHMLMRDLQPLHMLWLEIARVDGCHPKG